MKSPSYQVSPPSHRFTFTDVGASEWLAEQTIMPTLEPYKPAAARPTQPLSPFRSASSTIKESPKEPINIAVKDINNELYGRKELPQQLRSHTHTVRRIPSKRRSRIDDEVHKSSNDNNGNSSQEKLKSIMHVDKDKGKETSVTDILAKFKAHTFTS